MKVLVTGAAGGLGSHAAAALHESGHEVVGTDLRFPGSKEFPFVVADLLRFDSVYPLVDGCDVVVHIANHANVHSAPAQRLYTENCSMNVNVFQAARELRVPRILFASSIQVVSGDDNSHDPAVGVPAHLPLDNRLPVKPRNVYSLSKYAGESMLAAMVDGGLHLGVSVRFPYLIRRSHLKRKVFAKQKSDEERISIGTVVYLRIEDAASLFVSILRCDPAGSFTLLPTAADNLLKLSATELRGRYFPEAPLLVPEAKFDRFADLSHVVAIAPDWSPTSCFPAPVAAENPA